MYGAQVIKRSLMALAAILLCSTGTVWANDCQIQVTQSVVDYGPFNPHALKASAKSAASADLGKRFMQLNILCDDVQRMALSFQGLAYGLEGYKLSDNGEFELALKDARLDGEPVLLGAISSAGDTPGEGRNAMKLMPGQYLVPVVNQQLKTGKALSISVVVDARLFVDRLKVRDVVELEGQGYFQVN
jgi:hypothetical protein